MPRIKMQRRKAKEGRAAIYARVSDQSQDAEDKTSISEQISDMEATAKGAALTIVARYQEVGTGAGRRSARSFQRMLADARARALRHHRPAGSPTGSAGACTPQPPSWRWSRRTT